jgi:RimJ/RimL family protein N-acetyltransferase
MCCLMIVLCASIAPMDNRTRPIIETSRLILRQWRQGDREPFAAMNADPRVMEFMTHVLSREESDEFVDRIEAQFARHGFCLYAAELRDSNRFIGFIGIHVPRFEAAFTPCVEIGWRLSPDVWGQGLATEGGHAVVAHAFGNLRLEELVSFTARMNKRAQHLIEKMGMTRDPAEDFDHPLVPAGNPLVPHVLYRLRRGDRQP